MTHYLHPASAATSGGAGQDSITKAPAIACRGFLLCPAETAHSNGTRRRERPDV